MIEKDALFFVQLLLPLIDPARSGIDGNPRRAFNSEVSKNTNAYAIERKGRGGDFGLKFDFCTLEELVINGIVVRNQGRNLVIVETQRKLLLSCH